MPNQNKPTEEEIDAMVDMAKKIVRESRRNTLAKLNNLVRAFANKYGLESDAAIEKNFRISPLVNDSDTQKLFFMDKQIALIDWVECELYEVSEND